MTTLYLVDHVDKRHTEAVATDYAIIRRAPSHDRDRWSRADRNRARRLEGKRMRVVRVLRWSKRPRFRERSPWEEGLRTLVAGRLMPVVALQAMHEARMAAP